jgi:GNAT superfamily N-acetyltransferase
MTPAPVYALLTDGSTVQIRTAEPGDYEAVKTMHEAMSPDNIYLRFFNASPLSAGREAQRLCREPRDGYAALLAVSGEQIVGCASYESLKDGNAAEVAFAVADGMHRKGIATLLLEHLVVRARHDGIPAFVATTLAENTKMLHVFADAGLPVRARTRTSSCQRSNGVRARRTSPACGTSSHRRPSRSSVPAAVRGRPAARSWTISITTVSKVPCTP